MALELGEVIGTMGGPGGLELIHDQTEGLTQVPDKDTTRVTLASFDVPAAGAVIVRLDAEVGSRSGTNYTRTISAWRDGVLAASKWYSFSKDYHPDDAGFHLSFSGQAGSHSLTYQGTSQFSDSNFSPTRLRVYLARGLTL